ncbi:MAG: methylaspartate mutase subunit E, partial [Oscillospiraceae bacterium]
MDIQNKKWSDELFYKIREEEVMGQWPTGKEVDLKEAIDYQKAIPDHKSFTKKLNDAKAKGIT